MAMCHACAILISRFGPSVGIWIPKPSAGSMPASLLAKARLVISVAEDWCRVVTRNLLATPMSPINTPPCVLAPGKRMRFWMMQLQYKLSFGKPLTDLSSAFHQYELIRAVILYVGHRINACDPQRMALYSRVDLARVAAEAAPTRMDCGAALSSFEQLAPEVTALLIVLRLVTGQELLDDAEMCEYASRLIDSFQTGQPLPPPHSSVSTMAKSDRSTFAPPGHSPGPKHRWVPVTCPSRVCPSHHPFGGEVSVVRWLAMPVLVTRNSRGQQVSLLSAD
ncbi:unnamed protein product [Mycena citricolor]|uniref:Uncharacterized protein n=1 Tax=Mycena citricolor TaxID=2018698 RepID=A0AAD2HV34_9AGAR|nr:unnamed protein product [Mycena citricolor]